MSTNVGVDTATAAARRRQRRLRSWLRHERMTVAMTLAEKLHHTSRGQKFARVGEEVVNDAHDALRGQKTPPPGVRPGSLSDPGPQRSDRTVRRSSGEVPLLAVPVLAGGDGVDGTALSFLVRRAVEDRKREEEEKARKKKEAQEKADLELAKRDPWWAQHLADMKAMEQRRSGNPSSASSSKRKRKKRSKRKLPKSSSGVRIRRCGQGFCSRSSFSGAQCSRLLTTGPRCSTSWPVLNRRTVMCSSCARLVFLAFLHLALCFLPCLQARDARHHGRYGPGGFFRHVQGLVCWYLTMSFALCSSWLSQAQDARHHGRHGPQDSYVEVHRCSSWTRSLICPLVCYEWRHGPDSADNCLAIPQVQLIITVVVTPFRCAVGSSPWSRLFS